MNFFGCLKHQNQFVRRIRGSKSSLLAEWSGRVKHILVGFLLLVLAFNFGSFTWDLHVSFFLESPKIVIFYVWKLSKCLKCKLSTVAVVQCCWGLWGTVSIMVPWAISLNISTTPVVDCHWKWVYPSRISLKCIYPSRIPCNLCSPLKNFTIFTLTPKIFHYFSTGGAYFMK